MANDPYTAVHDGLWALLESHVKFQDLVKVSNRIKFTGDARDPMKDTLSTADLPEVRIIPTTTAPQPHRTSSSHSDMTTWEIQTATGDKRIDAFLLPLKWIIYEAMADVEEYLKANVTWNGEHIVRLARPVSTRSGANVADEKRGIAGWSSVWAIDVEIWFNKAAFSPKIQPVDGP